MVGALWRANGPGNALQPRYLLPEPEFPGHLVDEQHPAVRRDLPVARHLDLVPRFALFMQCLHRGKNHDLQGYGCRSLFPPKDAIFPAWLMIGARTPRPSPIAIRMSQIASPKAHAKPQSRKKARPRITRIARTSRGFSVGDAFREVRRLRSEVPPKPPRRRGGR